MLAKCSQVHWMTYYETIIWIIYENVNDSHHSNGAIILRLEVFKDILDTNFVF